MGSIDDLVHSLLIRPEEQEGWEVRETEGERQGRRGGGRKRGEDHSERTEEVAG